MNIKELKEYILEHIEELESDQEEYPQSEEYLAGIFDTYQHILGKLG